MPGDRPMSHDPVRIRSDDRIPASEVQGDNQSVWQIESADADYPPQFRQHPFAAQWKTIYGIGNREIIQHRCLGLICSVQCPGSVIIKTFDAIRELRDAGIVVVGGFHSPMEKECLDFLLRGNQPVIVCPAKHPTPNRMPAVWRKAIDSGRLLVISSFDEKVRRTIAAQAQTRNEFVAALSEAILVPHASPQGKTEALALSVLQAGGSLFTLGDEDNGNLITRGADSYDAIRVRDRLWSAHN